VQTLRKAFPLFVDGFAHSIDARLGLPQQLRRLGEFFHLVFIHRPTPGLRRFANAQNRRAITV